MINVVVFPGWYPSEVDVLSGDFGQRHMLAIAEFCQITMVFAAKNAAIKKSRTVKKVTGNLTEVFYYYPSVSSNPRLDGIYSFIHYNYRCVTYLLREKRRRKIDLVHIYILQKNHFIGLFAWLFLRIPYVVSEHSSFYIDGGFDRAPMVLRRLTSFVFSHARSVHAVSEYLLSKLRGKFPGIKHGIVIPNVVDVSLFRYMEMPCEDPFTFIHVSNMAYPKNVEGMLEAFALLKERGIAFRLKMVGPVPGYIHDLIKLLDLTAEVALYGQQSYPEVARHMQSSHVLVLFTRFETFGCVLIEANACGLPVIVTQLPAPGEIIDENENGLFVQKDNVDDLACKLRNIIRIYPRFDRKAIARKASENYNYSKIGYIFVKWYDTLINSK